MTVRVVRRLARDIRADGMVPFQTVRILREKSGMKQSGRAGAHLTDRLVSPGVEKKGCRCTSRMPSDQHQCRVNC